MIASHSSVYALCPVFRNLKDDQIKAVAKNGGVIQINFYSGFIDSNYMKRVSLFMSHHKNEYDSLVALKTPDYEVNGFFSKKYPQKPLPFDHRSRCLSITLIISQNWWGLIMLVLVPTLTALNLHRRNWMVCRIIQK